MRVLALLIGLYFLPLISNAAAEESPIEWELRYPINLFGKASRAEPRVLFRDPEAMQYDWGYQRDLYVSADCASDQNPILCSETRLGPNRIANMKAMMSGGNSADPNDNSNVRNVMIATGSGYNQDTRLYSTKKEDLHPIKVRLSLNVWKDYKCQWSRDDLALPVWITRCGDWLKNISIKRGEDSSTLTVKVLDPNGGAPVFETKFLARKLA